MEDIEASNATDGLRMTQEEVRRTSVERLLDAGHLPNRQLRQRIRPERPASVTMHVMDYHQEGRPQKVIVSIIDEAQFALLQRRLNGYIRIRPTQMVELANSQLGRMIIDAQ